MTMPAGRQAIAGDLAPLTWAVVAKSVVAVPVTGTISETVLATVVLPAGTIGLNGQIKVTAFWSVTNSANTKTLRVRFGGSSCLSVSATTMALGLKSETIIANRNAMGSQFTITECARGTDGLVTTNSASISVDTASSQNISLSGQLANVGETITLEGYIVEYLS